jgi:hypothetical protein
MSGYSASFLATTSIDVPMQPQARALHHRQLKEILTAHVGRGLEERHLNGFVDRLYVDLFRHHAMSVADLEASRPLSRVRRTILANALRVEPILDLERSIHSEYDGSRRVVFRVRRTIGAKFIRRSKRGRPRRGRGNSAP